MHRTTINIDEPLFQQARIKALREDTTVSEVIRDLLTRWATGKIDLGSAEHSREKVVALARSARGMWADRDDAAYVAASRSGLNERDEELAHARMDAG